MVGGEFEPRIWWKHKKGKKLHHLHLVYNFSSSSSISAPLLLLPARPNREVVDRLRDAPRALSSLSHPNTFSAPDGATPANMSDPQEMWKRLQQNMVRMQQQGGSRYAHVISTSTVVSDADIFHVDSQEVVRPILAA